MSFGSKAGRIYAAIQKPHKDGIQTEGFRSILKRERYYGRRFVRRHNLAQMIHQQLCLTA